MFPKQSFALNMRSVPCDEPKTSVFQMEDFDPTQKEYQLNMLKKIFPNINENVLELIFRAYDCNLERTVEHLMKTVSLGTNLVNSLPLKMQTQSFRIQNEGTLSKNGNREKPFVRRLTTLVSTSKHRLEPEDRYVKMQSILKPRLQSNNNRGLTCNSGSPDGDVLQKSVTDNSQLLNNSYKPTIETSLNENTLNNSRSQGLRDFSIDSILS